MFTGWIPPKNSYNGGKDVTKTKETNDLRAQKSACGFEQEILTKPEDEERSHEIAEAEETDARCASDEDKQ